MSAPPSERPQCRVVDGGKLPPASGGVAALCAAIERAMAMRASGVAVSTEVQVLSSSRLSAIVIANGRTLPAQNFARMDRDLDASAFERFAEVLAAEAAKAK